MATHFAENLSNKFGSEITELWENFGSDFTYPVNLPAYVDEYFQEENMKTGITSLTPPGNIQCLPVPGMFQDMTPLTSALL